MQDDPLLRRADLAILESKIIRREVRGNLALARLEGARVRGAHIDVTHHHRWEMADRLVAGSESRAEKEV